MTVSSSTSTDSYVLLQTLTPQRTFLCSDLSSNILVLKRLDADCLYQRRLHPSIRERLAHVRDLPHGRLATLRGVERWNDQVCLVWSWLDGENWEDASEKPIENLGSLASALVEAVDSLHEMGIVHGNLHGGNVIVQRDSQVWLTDVSPYLYTDPAVDIAAVAELLALAGEKLSSEMAARLAELLDELRSGSLDLRQLSRTLRGLSEPPPPEIPADTGKSEGYRTSSLIAAVLVAAIGASIWLGVRHFTSGATQGPGTFPSLNLPARASW